MTIQQRAYPLAVLALLQALGAYPSARCGPTTTLDKPRPVVIVETVYPGASAAVVADTVAAPIEQQVNGVEKMVHMSSRSGDDGSYTLTVAFQHGVDLNVAQVLIQNRVSLAQPVLPDAVKRRGVTVKRHSAGVLLLVSVSSPDGGLDTLYLSTYARIRLKDELARLPGVGDVTGLGLRDYSLRVLVDPEKLASLNLTAGDVIRAIEVQNVEVAAEQTGQPPEGKGPRFSLTVKNLGRLTEPEQFENLVVKSDSKGRVVRLKDVARVELGASDPQSRALLNGKSAVVLGIYHAPPTRPREVSTAVKDLLSRLRMQHPRGVLVEVALDFTPNVEAPDRPASPEYLLLDVDMPAGVSTDRTLKVLERCAALLRDVAGVQDVLALTDNPFDRVRNRGCILVRLALAGKDRVGREQLARTIRTRLEAVEGMTLRLRDLSGLSRFPRCGYPIDLAVQDCCDGGEVGKLAEKLAERLRRSKKLTDVWANPESTPVPQLQVKIDRTKMKALGVSVDDVFTTLRVYFGGQHVGDPNEFGRTSQVNVPAEPGSGKEIKDLEKLKIRNAKGDMVPFGALASVREMTGPVAVTRVNLYPAVEITANPTPGVSLAEARALCEILAEEAQKEVRMPKGYRLTWLQDLPTRK